MEKFLGIFKVLSSCAFSKIKSSSRDLLPQWGKMSVMNDEDYENDGGGSIGNGGDD